MLGWLDKVPWLGNVCRLPVWHTVLFGTGRNHEFVGALQMTASTLSNATLQVVEQSDITGCKDTSS